MSEGGTLLTIFASLVNRTSLLEHIPSMGLFFRLINHRMLWLILCVTMVMAIATSVGIALHKGAANRMKSILVVWIGACLFLMLYVTVIGRAPNENANVMLTPFWSIGAMRDGLVETYYEKIYNVLFFIPLGALFGLFFRRKVMARHLLAGAIVSISIELLQLLTRTGTCETDDVICNTLGCIMGALMVYAIRCACRR